MLLFLAVGSTQLTHFRVAGGIYDAIGIIARTEYFKQNDRWRRRSSLKKNPNVIYKKEQIIRMNWLYLGVYAHSETTKNDELSKFMRTSCAWRYLDYPIIFFRAGYRRHSPFLHFPDYIRCKLKKIIVNNTNEKKKIINISKSAIHNTFPSYSSGYINEVWPETLFNELYKILAKTFRISYMNKYTARLGVNGRGVQLRVRD
jgi:hypothetical protein